MNKHSDWLAEFVPALDSSGQECLEREIDKALRAQNSRGTITWMLWKMDTWLTPVRLKAARWLSTVKEKHTDMTRRASYFRRYMQTDPQQEVRQSRYPTEIVCLVNKLRTEYRRIKLPSIVLSSMGAFLTIIAVLSSILVDIGLDQEAFFDPVLRPLHRISLWSAIGAGISVLTASALVLPTLARFVVVFLTVKPTRD